MSDIKEHELLKVTRDNIQHGEKACHNNCAVALAIKDLFDDKLKSVSVNGAQAFIEFYTVDEITLGTGRIVLTFDEKTSEFIEEFDNIDYPEDRDELTPFELKLDWGSLCHYSEKDTRLKYTPPERNTFRRVNSKMIGNYRDYSPRIPEH